MGTLFIWDVINVSDGRQVCSPLSVNEENSQTKNNHTEDDVSPVAFAGKAPEKQITSPNCQCDPYDPRQDVLYRRYLGATIAGVFGGIAGLAFIGYQTVLGARNTAIAKKAAKAALKNAQAVINSERARIDVELIPAPNNRYSSIVRNIGKSPAIMKEYTFSYDSMNDRQFEEFIKLLDNEEDWGARMSEPPMFHILAPSKRGTHFREHDIPSLFQSSYDPLRHNIVGIRLEYADIFNKIRITEVFYSVTFDTINKNCEIEFIPRLTMYT